MSWFDRFKKDVKAEETKIAKHKYGCKPDLPDQRDHMMKLVRTLDVITALPPVVDLSPNCPPVVDQGQIGSCTSCGIANAHRFDQKKQKFNPDWLPSRLFIYYNERKMEGTVNSDSGAAIRDGIKSIASQGVCPETEWVYNINKFKNKPSCKCYKDALNYIAINYMRVNQDLNDLKLTLNAGYPIVIGISVYESFESDEVAKTGIVPMPAANEQLLGGHCILLCGFSDPDQRFKCQNSWGSSWGMQGFFTIPYTYLTNPNLASDFWVVELVK